MVVKHRRFGKRDAVGWAMILPAVIWNLFVMTIPIVALIYLSFTSWDLIGAPRLVGIVNYARLFTDRVLGYALMNNVKWIVTQLVGPIIFALFVSQIVSNTRRGQMTYRTIFFIPYVLSAFVAVRMWLLIYSPAYGVDVFFSRLGLQLPNWIGNQGLAIFSVSLARAWQYWVFLMVLFLTALQNCNVSLEEAAYIEGASRVRIYISVRLPQIAPTIAIAFMLTTMWGLYGFAFVFLMTDGGPGFSSELLATYMYKELLVHRNGGYAATIAMCLGFLSLILILLFALIRRRRPDL